MSARLSAVVCIGMRLNFRRSVISHLWLAGGRCRDPLRHPVPPESVFPGDYATRSWYRRLSRARASCALPGAQGSRASIAAAPPVKILSPEQCSCGL